MNVCDDEKYMRFALEEAAIAESLGEVPVGAVIVKNSTGEVVSRAHNLRNTSKNAIRHAEITAIEKACEKLGGWRLPGCTLYVTLEPCPMCAGASINARVERVVFGAKDVNFGACGTVMNLNALAPQYEVQYEGGILEEECSEILSRFFKELRAAKKSAKAAEKEVKTD